MDFLSKMLSHSEEVVLVAGCVGREDITVSLLQLVDDAIIFLSEDIQV